MSAATDLTIARLASVQLGHATRGQLIDAGLSSDTVRRRVNRGRLIPAGGSTFRLPSWPASPHGDVMAVCLDLDAVASHRTAAWLHRLTARPRIIEVSTAKGRSIWPPRPGANEVRVHTSTNLPAEDVIHIDGVPTTSLARTMLGVAALVPGEMSDPDFFDLVCRSIEEGQASLPWLWWILDQRRCRGRNGVTALERALVKRSRLGPTESWLEREVLRILDHAHLPRPRLQGVIRRTGPTAARVDFLYEREWVVLEALGYAFHRTEEQQLADTRRANDLTVRGYQVLQFPSRQIARDPGSVVTTVREALASPQRRMAG